MSETSEAAAKKPLARKTTTTGTYKTAAKKSTAKTPKTKTVKPAEEVAPALAIDKPEANETAAKALRKRAAPKSAGRKTSPKLIKQAESAPAADQIPPLSRAILDEEQPVAVERGAAKAKTAAKTPASSRRTSKKQPETEAGALPGETSASHAPMELTDEAPPTSAAGPAANKSAKSSSNRWRSSVSAVRAKKAAPKPEMSTEIPAEPVLPVAEPAASVAVEAAGDGEQPREKSRRPRSRRGRRKSAGARAAAQARQDGEQTVAEETPPADGESDPTVVFETFEGGGAERPAEAEYSIGGEDNEEPLLGKREGKQGKDGKGAREAEKFRQKRKMFVSVLPGEQVEVVLTAEGQVQEYYVEMLHHVKVKGNIYKGVIHNVDANLQAAFVSYGAAKNGFLQIDEVHPEYYLSPHEPSKGHKYPLIQKMLKPGQEILVQVVKEPSGTKGAFLTSYLSLAGRFLVLTPGREQIGVSRKVDNEEERSRLRELLSGLNPGEGLGVIVRTVSSGATKTSLQKDLQLLKRVWKDVRKRGSTEPAPCLIYQELGLDTRAVRDYLTDEVIEVWVDDEEMAAQIRELVNVLFPRKSGIVQVHKDLDSSLFERFGLRKQLEQVHSREVTLPSGGRLVFDHTEALMAIDINSGRSAGKNNFEDTAFKTNLEAAQQIPLQLRLRDIGGQVVIDFIEMRDRSHWREVEKAVRAGMKNDRARHDIGKISSFGLMEIVRQRLSSSAISTTVEPCPCCKGTGQRRNLEWQAMQVLRDIRAKLRKQSAAGSKPGRNGSNGNGGNGGNDTLTYSGNPELILYLLNNKRERLAELEKNSGLHLELKPE